jgi:hypothetical protein
MRCEIGLSMCEITNWTEGSIRLSEDTVVHAAGTIEDDLTVPANTRLDLHGGVGGDLIVERGVLPWFGAPCSARCTMRAERWRFVPALRSKR